MGNSPTEPKTCRHPEIGSDRPDASRRDPATVRDRHNPFVYFHSIIDTPACDQNVVPLDALDDRPRRSAKKTPNLDYITPNLCNDGHDKPCVDGQPGGLVSADRWLAEWVPKILASPAFKRDGMLSSPSTRPSSSGTRRLDARAATRRRRRTRRSRG